MAKITIPDIASQFASQEALNARFTQVENELNDKVLYRDNPNGEPNAMAQELDMNTNRIINLPEPVSPNDAARLQDLTTATLDPDSIIATQTEAATLTAGQTTVVFATYETEGASFHLSGPNVDDARLVLGRDFIVTSSTTIQLSQSYPAGTTLQLLRNAIAGEDALVIQAQAAYDTVAQMKLDFSVAGTLIQTKGYYTAGDGGGASYLVAASQTVDGYGDHALAGGTVALLQPGSPIDVKQYGAKGDGSAEGSAAIEQAVARAYSVGTALYWQEGDYTSLATIPNLHKVRHTGTGVIVRGAGRFTLDPEPSDTNYLYVSTTGADTNDGLSASEPLLDYGMSYGILENYGPVLGGGWIIRLAAGTYPTTAFAAPLLVQSARNLQWEGPDVGGTPNVPTAIIDGLGVSAIAFYFNNGIQANFVDIKIINFPHPFSGGILADKFSNIYTQNIHGSGNGTTLYITGNSDYLIQGGVLEDLVAGIQIGPSCHGDVKSATDSLAGGVLIDGSQYGVTMAELSTGHVDYATIQNCTAAGIIVYNNARCNAAYSDLKRNLVGIEWNSGGIVLDSTVEFNTSTVDGNTTDRIINGSQLPQVYGSNWKPAMRLAWDINQYSHTGDTTKTVLASPVTIPANTFIEENRTYKVKISGTKTGTAGIYTVGVAFSGATVVSNAGPAGTAAGVFLADFTITAAGATSQRSWANFTQSGVAPQVRTFLGSAAAVDTDKTLDIEVTLGNAGDTIYITGIEVELIG